MVPDRKKRSFLLLEVLIALLIVSLCLVPLLQSPILSYRSEIEHLEEMEGERLADWTFSEIKEKLLKNEIPWERLPGPESKAGPFRLSSYVISVPGVKKKKIERSFTLYCGKRGEKQGDQGEVFRFFRVQIDFEPRLMQKKKRKHSYWVTARKLPREMGSRSGGHSNNL